MLTYKFTYKRKGSLFWKTYVVKGHGLEYIDEKSFNAQTRKYESYISKPNNSMILYFPDGSILRISEWDKCDLKLGVDWLLAQKKSMEQEIGQPIQLKE